MTCKESSKTTGRTLWNKTQTFKVMDYSQPPSTLRWRVISLTFTTEGPSILCPCLESRSLVYVVVPTLNSRSSRSHTFGCPRGHVPSGVTVVTVLSPLPRQFEDGRGSVSDRSDLVNISYYNPYRDSVQEVFGTSRLLNGS